MFGKCISRLNKNEHAMSRSRALGYLENIVNNAQTSKQPKTQKKPTNKQQQPFNIKWSTWKLSGTRLIHHTPQRVVQSIRFYVFFCLWRNFLLFFVIKFAFALRNIVKRIAKRNQWATLTNERLILRGVNVLPLSAPAEVAHYRLVWYLLYAYVIIIIFFFRHVTRSCLSNGNWRVTWHYVLNG